MPSHWPSEDETLQTVEALRAQAIACGCVWRDGRWPGHDYPPAVELAKMIRNRKKPPQERHLLRDAGRHELLFVSSRIVGTPRDRSLLGSSGLPAYGWISATPGGYAWLSPYEKQRPPKGSVALEDLSGLSQDGSSYASRVRDGLDEKVAPKIFFDQNVLRSIYEAANDFPLGTSVADRFLRRTLSLVVWIDPAEFRVLGPLRYDVMLYDAGMTLGGVDLTTSIGLELRDGQIRDVFVPPGLRLVVHDHDSGAVPGCSGDCRECGEACFIDGSSCSHHGEPEAIDYEADRRHVAILDDPYVETVYGHKP